MSGNPWVRGAGGSRPEPEVPDQPDEPAGPRGFSGVQLPPRPQSFDQGRRGGRSGRGGGGGFLSKLPGGGPPLPVVIVVAVVVVLAIVGGLAYALLGGSSTPQTTPTPSPTPSTSATTPTTPTTPSPTTSSSPASSTPSTSSSPARATRPANATTVSAVGGWLVPATGWGASSQTATDENSQPGSRELAYPKSGGAQAHYWVRGKNQGAQAWALAVEGAYAQQYPGLRLTRRAAFGCPSGFTTCYQVAYAYTYQQVSMVGSFTAYERSSGPSVGIDFGTPVTLSARANADALAMTTSLFSSL